MVERYLGEIRLFGGNYAPVGWSFCNGQLLAIAGNEALYSVIGTSYGGDGRVSFALPDLRGRVAVGAGAGPDLSPRQLGQRFGHEAVGLTEAEMPNHTHAMRASADDASSAVAQGHVLAKGPADSAFYLPDDSAGIVLQTMNDDAVAVSGSGAAHLNMMPWTALSYIIAMTGNYPTTD